MDAPNAQLFETLQGQRFELRAEEEGPWAAELIRVSRSLGEPYGGREPFSLLFRGPVSPVLPQRIYQVSGAALTAIDIFLVPVGASASGVEYEAVFS